MRDALTRQAGVTDVKINIQTNWVTMHPAKDRYVPVERISPAIVRAGYKPTNYSLTATGRFEGEGDNATFRFNGWPHVYSISGVESPPTGEVTIEAAVIATGNASDVGRGVKLVFMSKR